MSPIAWLEADMARHMLVEFPLLVAKGALTAQATPARMRAWLAPIDRYGLAGWTFASVVLAFWMIPAAIDAAIASPAVNAFKYASLAAAGFALRAAMERSPFVLEAFFVGNLAWMGATVGLLYEDAEVRLCLSYLTDSQARAGRGLVILSVAALIAWFSARRCNTGARIPANLRPQSTDP